MTASPEPEPEPDALAAVTARVRAALSGDLPDTAAEVGPYLATAADGLVSAEVAADGSLRALVLDPQVFDRPLAEVAEASRIAVNRALESLPGRVDVSPIVAQVRAAQVEARRSLGAVTQGMADVERRVRAEREGRN